MTEANRTMNFTTGPIYLAYVMAYQGTQYFYLALHYLISDGMSINLLAEDICTLLNGQPLPGKTLPYAMWSQNLDGLREKVRTLDSYELPNEDELVLPPTDVDQIRQSESSQHHHFSSAQLNLNTALALEQFGQRDTNVEDIILVGLLHGRNALGNPWDVSRTVGFFINTCPIVLHRVESDDLQSTLDGVQSTLRVSDFAVKYMLGGHSWKAPIGYNFLGKHNTSNSTNANGVEMMNVVASEQFLKQQVKQNLMPLVFPAQYMEDRLMLFVHYEFSLYSAELMSNMVEKWVNSIHLVKERLGQHLLFFFFGNKG
ncbi:hypothetical protein IWQ61_010503 [Dispira simplex]|nr:hypothetical protein IWQ61_010503 [Dispira simplex]